MYPYLAKTIIESRSTNVVTDFMSIINFINVNNHQLTLKIFVNTANHTHVLSHSMYPYLSKTIIDSKSSLKWPFSTCDQQMMITSY